MALLGNNDREFMELVKVFLRDNYKGEIASILSQEDETAHYSVSIPGFDVIEYCVQIFDRVCSTPLETFKLLDQCLYSIQKEIHKANPENLTVKDNIHVRLVKLPQCAELLKTTLPRTYDTGKFQIITGTIIRMTPAKLLEYKRDFQCPKCKFLFEVESNIIQYFKFDKPKTCPNPLPCNGTKFRSLGDANDEPTWCRDMQEVKIQEKIQHISVGRFPTAMWIILYDDLVDSCKPGNDVRISGVVMQRWKPLVNGARPEIEMILLAHDVEITNKTLASSVSNESIKDIRTFWNKNKNNPLECRNKIIASICPQIYGLYLVKLSLALVLTGGKKRDDCATKVRAESHLLLIGDPGTAKSQFLKFAAKVSPRSVLTTGIGSTSAGLTVAAVKEEGQWQLEAGALVLANGGVCCIDEFNSMAEKDRACIHEAMEQQTISIAKAGMVCKLCTECAVIAATNPKESKLNLNHSISVNTSIASPLLSRFDIVLVLEDNRSEEWDTLVSSHILSRRTISAPKSSSHWNIQKLREYFCHIKSIEPVMSDDARTVILKYYQCLRNLGTTTNASRTTVRMLDSLMRLVQAHARIMYCDTVYVRDAIVVITIVESSFQGSAFIESSSALTTIFPNDADKEYLNQAEIILTKLELKDILERERKIIRDMKNGVKVYKNYDYRITLDELRASTQKSPTKTPRFTQSDSRELPSRIDETPPREENIIQSIFNFNDENSVEFLELDFNRSIDPKVTETGNSKEKGSKKTSTLTLDHKTLGQNYTNITKKISNLRNFDKCKENSTKLTTDELETLTENYPKVKESKNKINPRENSSSKLEKNLNRVNNSKKSSPKRRNNDETLNQNESKTKCSITSNSKDSSPASNQHHLASMLETFAYKKTKSPQVRSKQNLSFRENKETKPSTSQSTNSSPKVHNLLTEEAPKSKEPSLSSGTISKLQMFAFEENELTPVPINPPPKHSQPIKRNAFVLVESDDEEIDFEEHSSFLDHLLLPNSYKRIKK